MSVFRHTLTHLRPVLYVPLLLACGTAHGLGDGGSVPDPDAGRARDAGSVDAGSTDAGSGTDAGARDAGPRGTCDAEDARAELCPELLCDGLSTWHWDGETCVVIDCGACVGADCALGVTSQMECVAAHASCDAPLCRSSGGTWLWWAELCGHYSCGHEPPAICESGWPGCDCGDGQNFVPGVGCQLDPSCPEVDPLPPEMLCVASGGTWDASCCHTECGVPCAAACAAPACTCGPLEVFHPLRGCEVGQRCMERVEGETCTEEARCLHGTLCCDNCGGAGCAGNPICNFPVCDGNPDTDICGNNLLAP